MILDIHRTVSDRHPGAMLIVAAVLLAAFFMSTPEAGAAGVEYLQADSLPAQESPGGKQAFPFGWKGAAVPETALKNPLRLSWQAGKSEQLPSRLRITVIVDVREEKLIDVNLATSGTRIGTFDIRFASALEPFEIPIDANQAKGILAEGVLLQMTRGDKPLWILADAGTHEASAKPLMPHLLIDHRADPEKEFLSRMKSLACVQQFGWMEGCVLDGLFDLAQKDASFKPVLQEHIALFINGNKELAYEGPNSEPLKNRLNTIESTLPFAVLAKIDATHPALNVARDYWKRSRDAQGVNVDGGTITTEASYTVAYPLAVLARLNGDAALRAQAIEQLAARKKYLTRADAVFQRGKMTGAAPGYRNWARGVAWYMLGLTRSLIELKDHSDETVELRAELLRAAEVLQDLQRENGLWGCFADKPQSAPDTAGSSGIAAALALAVRHGLLPEKFRAVAEKTRRGVVPFLTPDGFLGGCAQSNKGGLGLQEGNYRVIYPMGMGLLAQLHAALEP